MRLSRKYKKASRLQCFSHYTPIVASLPQPCSTMDRLSLKFGLELSFDDVLNVVTITPQLKHLRLTFTPDADVTVSPTRGAQHPRVNLTHLRTFSVECSRRQHYPLVDRLLSCVDISAKTEFILRARQDNLDIAGSGRGLFELQSQGMDPALQAFWCHLVLSSKSCALIGATQRLAAGNDDSARIPLFTVRADSDQASPAFCMETMRNLPSFLSARPITRLWISIDGLTQIETPWAIPFEWSELLSSVPDVEEFALRVDIWARYPACSALVGSADALFGLLRYQYQDGSVVCPNLHRLWLVFVTRTVSLVNCLTGIRDLVRFRRSVGAEILQLHLAVDGERWGREACADERVMVLRQEIVSCGVDFREEFDLSKIRWPEPST